MKPVAPQSAAEADVNKAFDYYWEQGGRVLAERFLDAYDAALNHIAEHPGTGSTRYALQGDATPLRFWTLRRFPFAIFYTEHPDHITVVRVLHQSSDLPHHLN